MNGVFAVPPGFEPRPREPKSLVLPLHHGTGEFRILNIECRLLNFGFNALFRKRLQK